MSWEAFALANASGYIARMEKLANRVHDKYLLDTVSGKLHHPATHWWAQLIRSLVAKQTGNKS